MTRYIWLIGVLVTAAAAYAGFWFLSAANVESAILAWQRGEAARGRRAAFEDLQVAGFPFRLLVRMRAPSLAWPQHPNQLRWQAEKISAVSHPWSLNKWIVNVTGRHRLEGRFNGAERRIEIASARGLATYQAVRGRALGRLSLDMHNVEVAGLSEDRIAAARVQLHLRPSAAAGASVDLALSGEKLTVAPGPAAERLGARIERASADLSVIGRLKPPFGRDSLETWRRDGGAVEVRRAELAWGAVAMSAQGTLALDSAGRAMGALTAKLKGHRALLDVAVGYGQISKSAAKAGKLLLDLLAAANGGELSVPLRLQDGRLHLGPVILARLRPILPAGGRSR